MPKDILIVEDEIVIVKDLESTLQDIGYHVCAVAATAEDAIQRTRDFQPDLILMDIRLRGKDNGIHAAMEIKKLFDIPVIYLTAFVDQQLIDQAKLTEPFGYIIKPVEPRSLEVAIEIALYKHHAEKERMRLQARLSELEKQVALQKRDERFRAFMDNSQILAWAKNADGHYVYLNKAYERLLEGQEKNWYGKTDSQLWSPDTADKFRNYDAAVLENGQPVEFIEESTGPQGDYSAWWMIKFCFEDEAGGKFVGGMAIDNTARLRAEEG